MPYTDVFIATDEDIAIIFRSWKRPAPLLDEFITKSVANPFTGKTITIRTMIRDEQPPPDSDAVEDGDFRKLPWMDQKGIYTVDLVSLASILMGWDRERSDSEIHGRLFCGPPRAEVALCEIPPVLVSRLSELGSDECKQVGREWSARRREDAGSIVIQSIREEQMARPDSEWISRLSDLSMLAKRAATEARLMFMWMSP
jgi:hypothetical protein